MVVNTIMSSEPESCITSCPKCDEKVHVSLLDAHDCEMATALKAKLTKLANAEIANKQAKAKRQAEEEKAKAAKKARIAEKKAEKAAKLEEKAEKVKEKEAKVAEKAKKASKAQAKKEAKEQKIKKGLTPYFCFTNSVRAIVKEKNPEASIGDVAKVIGRAWQKLDENARKAYIAMSEKDKERAAYEESHGIGARPDGWVDIQFELVEELEDNLICEPKEVTE
eukprot:GFYU01044381.1.p1 GENE.GFYU01044381.1~~GFYU01044381.1.p1  ORF type:complete len:223 (+),score=89.87 GFYU01044381.1:122-790(+)